MFRSVDNPHLTALFIAHYFSSHNGKHCGVCSVCCGWHISSSAGVCRSINHQITLRHRKCVIVMRTPDAVALLRTWNVVMSSERRVSVISDYEREVINILGSTIIFLSFMKPQFCLPPIETIPRKLIQPKKKTQHLISV